MKGLKETKAYETETVTFEVELSHADVEGSWNKDGAKLKSGSNCRITTLGKKHNLTLSNLMKEDAGLISFQAEGVHSSAKLIVAGKVCSFLDLSWPFYTSTTTAQFGLALCGSKTFPLSRICGTRPFFRVYLAVVLMSCAGLKTQHQKIDGQ